VKYRYHPHARAEASSAIAYYAEADAEVAKQFLNELEDTINRIQNMPEAWSKHIAGTRRCLLHRFPYGVIYLVESNAIEIAAVMHLHRRPGYWLSRTR
jgi:plasmid stabilization system protein ParE